MRGALTPLAWGQAEATPQQISINQHACLTGIISSSRNHAYRCHFPQCPSVSWLDQDYNGDRSRMACCSSGFGWVES
ncbi:hypothetical protein BO94DRAFT_536683 [Aspergillus sclerotioniger CBS 115572]|uniref:Uncharacterized protein n=1 Tax=Aspergillus sclerotioniger CBS 115572 TaxID=1450535 RepID=A0A317WBS0_9EURO|nr:hypothetical protein BO94DRAFT_536683 [Aspergillus sclerotioniger CBS 115572]PWY83211.1 hypothetical protein BO94DRAFT_536683 [Aspergillus sclerotioniger CBS 115572]